MLDTNVDTTPYKDVIAMAESQIANAGTDLPYSEYREACDNVLSNMYSVLESRGITDGVLLAIAADFVDVVSRHLPRMLSFSQ